MTLSAFVSTTKHYVAYISQNFELTGKILKKTVVKYQNHNHTCTVFKMVTPALYDSFGKLR